MTTQKEEKLTWKEIIRFLKEYGFIIENANLYGGLKSNYDYGPLGTRIKNNIKKLWKKEFIDQEKNVYQSESSVFTLPSVLKASGHLAAFKESVAICLKCQTEFKTQENKQETTLEKKINNPEYCQCWKNAELKQKQRSLLFQTQQGSWEGNGQNIFLRPEIAQSSFINLKKIMYALKLQLPLGIGQIGKVFRNELTTQYGNFRTCEFEQMEVQFFYAEKKENAKWFNYWSDKIENFLLKTLKLNPEMVRKREHQINELAHYAKQTTDFEYHFPFGWKEIWGLSDRNQYDLTNHQKFSNNDLSVMNSKQEKIIPFVVEPSVGVERLMLSLIVDKVRKKNNKITLKIPHQFCYYQVAVLPLTEKLLEPSKKVFDLIADFFTVRLDYKNSIGKRYHFHDAIGTYLCLTFDFKSLKDNSITIRFRDTGKQERININQVKAHLKELLENG